MPEYLAPGVFVEEVSFRAKSIEGVGTSVAAVVGPTRTGPLRGKPEVVTSFAEFQRIYGDAADLVFDDAGQALNHTAIAARAFFDNGGKQLFVARVASQLAALTPSANAMTPNTGVPAGSARFAHTRNQDLTPTTPLLFASRFPGAAGNLTLEVFWRDSTNLLRLDTESAPADGELLYMEAVGVPLGALAGELAGGALDARFPCDVRGLVRRVSAGDADGDHYVLDGNRAVIENTADGQPLTPADLERAGDAAGILRIAGGIDGATSATFTRVRLRAPANGAVGVGETAELRLNPAGAAPASTDLTAFTGGPGWGNARVLHGTIDPAAGTMSIPAALNTAVAGDIVLPLGALAAIRDQVDAVLVRRDFDIDVHAGGPDGEVIYGFAGMTTGIRDGDGNLLPNRLTALMPRAPQRRADQLSQPVYCAMSDENADIQAALFALFDPDTMNRPENDPPGPRYLITLAGGTDGNLPAAIDYTGEGDEVNGSTGFVALEDVEDISIVMAPAATLGDAVAHQGVVNAMQAHCRRMRYRIGVIEPREGMSQSEVREFRSNFSDDRLALYYPWVVTVDPTGVRPSITVPPAGFIAGIYANTDVQRGVHKAPANEVVIGALGFAQEVNRFQQELLNPNGINCLRSFPGRGHRVWGGRTLSADPEWKYVNVRRYFLFLERSIEKSTQWVVFEPNGERLWANVRSAVEDFLYNEWVNGRLLGGSPKAAYFVRCDRSTMTQNDLDNGRLVCLVGVAPLTPAEFVIFRIGQKTADA